MSAAAACASTAAPARRTRWRSVLGHSTTAANAARAEPTTQPAMRSSTCELGAVTQAASTNARMVALRPASHDAPSDAAMTTTNATTAVSTAAVTVVRDTTVPSATSGALTNVHAV